MVKNVASHMADMTVALTALNSGKFAEQANTKPPNAVFHVQYAGVDVESGAQTRQIEKCFKGVVGAFITYLDELIGVLQFASKPIIVDRTLTEPEIVPYWSGPRF